MDADSNITVTGIVPASGGQASAQVESDGRLYSGSVQVARRDPLLLGGSWQCTPVEATTPVCYARMQTAPGGQGAERGWHLPDYNDAFWPREWLSAERFAVTEWWVLGMFDYHHALGFNEVMPPERAINLEAEYAGRDGQPIRWQRYSSPGRIVDLDRALGTEVERSQAVRWVTTFALSHVYSPDERTVEVRCMADCNAKVWVNGDLVMAERDDHQGYIEMRDAFGISATVHLRQVFIGKQFVLTDEDLAYRLMLDLGTVGTTAEVWLNDVRIGERVWQPFTFDITAAARPGTNDLRVQVANTASNERARGHTDRQMWGVMVRGPELLASFEEIGLLGPVDVVPWTRAEILCST